MNQSSNLSAVKYLFFGTAAIISLSNSINYQDINISNKQNYESLIDNDSYFKYNGLMNENIINKTHENNTNTNNNEPIIKLESINKIKIKIGKIEALKLHVYEDKDGFVY